MTETPSEPPTATDVPVEHSAYIQRITTDWGALEFHVNECIWWLAEVRFGLGACITSQIYTLDGRLNALHALLKLRRAPQSLIDELNQLWEASRGPSEIRNRTVHDPWAVTQSGKVSRLEITAKRTLKFGFRPITVKELKADQEKVRECVLHFTTFRDKVKAALSALPEIPHEELEPITEGPPPKK